MVDFWIKFWSVFFFLSLGVFFVLAVVVTVGGFFNILSLFATLVKEHSRPDPEAVEVPEE